MPNKRQFSRYPPTRDSGQIDGVYQQDDRYGMMSHNKAFGYPVGDVARYKDGRPLTHCLFGSWGYFINIATGLNDIGGGLIFATSSTQAAIVTGVQLGLRLGNLTDTIVWGQLWAGGKQLMLFSGATVFVPVDIYIPPRHNVSFYYQIINNCGGDVCIQMSVNWTIFDESADVWGWGAGCNAQNPELQGLTWPLGQDIQPV